MSQQSRFSIENSQRGSVGVLRNLRQIQLSVPDKLFFINKYRNKRAARKKKEKSGFLSGLSRRSEKKGPKRDIEKAIEKVKQFHNTFQAMNRTAGVKKTLESGQMSVSAMNDFRKEIKDAATGHNTNFRWIALEAIVKFIDLKNSGIVKDKLLIQQDCLRKIGEALHEDGGLSMFHTTWFLTIYRDYLSGFKMFRTGEVESINRDGGKEAQKILKKLQRKQYELPVYLKMVDEKSIDAKLLLNYSKDNHVKMSKHGQRGCTRQDIKKLFHDTFKETDSTQSRVGRVNEVNIIMSYAMLFARIPMLYEVVEFIKYAIPNISTETKLYKHKISIAQKITLLDIASALYGPDTSDEGNKKFFQLANSIHRYCIDVISENRLNTVRLTSSIYTFPIMKQAALLITYRKIFRNKKSLYIDMLDQSMKLLESVKLCVKSGDQTLIKIAGYAHAYEQKLETLKYEIQMADKDKDKGKKHQKTGDK